MADILEFSESIVSLLCHDMAGPIGAINNGVELLKDPNPTYHEDSIDLIEISAKEAVARLLYYRQAYGNLKNQNGVSISTLKDLVDNYYENKKIDFHWPEAHNDTDSMQTIPNNIAKLLLNIVLLTANTLIHGGDVKIKFKTSKNNPAVKIRAEGKTVKMQEYILEAINKEIKEIKTNSKNAQVHLTKALVKKLGCKLTIDINENYVEILAE